ncbi:inner membrane protein [Escherichia coli]|uniref:Inner membrane protein n=1 Tax=Escherichia coli TaxID=562 RepID=A0A377DFX9_ECOLX|nr:inner membrane protein [Escherichia coli]
MNCGGICGNGLKADINSEDSRVKERIARAGQWFGETLIADDALRASLNGHLGTSRAPRRA